MKSYQDFTKRKQEKYPFRVYYQHYNNCMVELHWHPEVEIIYCLEGEVTVYAGEEQLFLKEGEICFINPEELHSYALSEETSNYYAAVFDTSLIQFHDKHFFEQEFTEPIVNGTLRFPRKIAISHPQYEVIEPIVKRLCKDDAENKMMFLADLIVLFSTLLKFSLMEQEIEGVADKRSEDIKTCIRYMQENCENKIELTELADLVHMSPNYFCSYFKKQTGVSPFTQLHYIRIKKASKMLLQSEMPIVSIAEHCGFENVSFFIRKFKEIQGCTPSVYRASVKFL